MNNKSELLKSIHLKNFGRFSENGLKVNFGHKLDEKKANLHIFVGENGSGKTTILKSIFFALYPFKESLISQNNENYFPRKMLENVILESDSSSTIPLFIYTPNEPEINFGYNKFSAKNVDTGNNLIYNWVCNYSSDEYLRYVEKLENNRNALLANSSKEKEEKLDSFQIAEIESEIKLTEKLEWFMKRVYGVDFKYKYKDIKEGYKPFLDNKFIEFSELSLGYRQIISLITDLLIKVWDGAGNTLHQREELKFVLILDEVEVHLHPKAQRYILPAMQELFPNAEIFCATHSPFIVNSVDDAWLYEVSEENFEENDNGVKVLEAKKTSTGNTYVSTVFSDFNLTELYGLKAQGYLKKLSDGLRNSVDVSDSICYLKKYKGTGVEDSVTVLLKQFNKLELWQD
jgi:predicted ATP-binding protein involved in virulence